MSEVLLARLAAQCDAAMTRIEKLEKENERLRQVMEAAQAVSDAAEFQSKKGDHRYIVPVLEIDRMYQALGRAALERKDG